MSKKKKIKRKFDKYWFKQKLDDYWLKHYVTRNGHCSLCGNRGIIDTSHVTTSSGIFVGREAYCICPNGRQIRKEHNKQS